MGRWMFRLFMGAAMIAAFYFYGQQLAQANGW
jgi:hypothetical protein